MIATFVLRALVISLLLAGAAWLLERGLRLWRLPTRAVCGVAMLAALLLPAVALVPRPERPTRGATIRIGAVERGLAPMERAWRRLGSISATGDGGPVIAAVWLLASLGVVTALARSAGRVAAQRAGWRDEVVDGEPALVSSAVGPAVVGLRRPSIVVPDWVLDLDEPRRRLILAHEREHLRARDPWLLAAGLAAVALEPWNVALWYLLVRLRLAVEVDCDRRVLRQRPDVRGYASLLIAVCQRVRPPLPMLAPTLAESASPLARRIAVMTAAAPRHRRLEASLIAVASLALIVVACNVPASDDASAARASTAGPTAVPGTKPFHEFTIDKPAVMAPGSPAPRYPEPERSKHVEGEVLAQYVVDTTGIAVPGSLRILESTSQSFTDAVRTALPSMRFIPAEVKGRKVKQLIQQPFTFMQSK